MMIVLVWDGMHLRAVGIKTEYGEPVKEAQYRGKFKTVGDEEHSRIIRLYIEERLSMDKIAKQLERSTKTPHTHIKRHNKAVERSGFCPTCRRAKSRYESEFARRVNSK